MTTIEHGPRQLSMQPANVAMLYCFSQGWTLAPSDIQRVLRVPDVNGAQLVTTGRTELGYCLVVHMGVVITPDHAWAAAAVAQAIAKALECDPMFVHGVEHPQAGKQAETFEMWAQLRV